MRTRAHHAHDGRVLLPLLARVEEPVHNLVLLHDAVIVEDLERPRRGPLEEACRPDEVVLRRREADDSV